MHILIGLGGAFVCIMLAGAAVAAAYAIIVGLFQIILLPVRAIMWIGGKLATPTELGMAMRAAEREAQAELRASRQ
ncbi:MAG TPA: hypothetical protein VGH84_05250 [Steroidobacteraceae bacterium]|jgi:hypothetical protein